MKAFTQIAFLASAASMVTANKLIFKSLDDTDRTVYCTPTVGFSSIEPATVSGGNETSIEFPIGWIGNCYAVQDGAENVPGMLAEIAWNQFEGKHFFDVSAIVNPHDKDNVREMYPKNSTTPVSGCESFPCNKVYYLPDDVQTQVTDDSEIICTLGKNGLSGLKSHNSHNSHSDSSKREEHPPVGRDYVMGKF